jgi:pyrroloquinoline quinone biosynthesis protein B
VQVILLGTAAGGGFPQWNCWCPTCRVARSDPGRARPRTQSSMAVSADGRRWFLVNASPDVREQLSRLPLEGTPPGTRHVPFEAVLLTDAELDHTLGIALLREARQLTVYATRAVTRTLDRDSRLLPVTDAFADVTVDELPLDEAVALRCRDGAPSGLTAEAFAVAGDPPRFAAEDAPGHTVGLLLRDAEGASCAFVPGCGAIDDRLLARIGGASLVLFDGTFWSSDELIALGVGDRRAEEMGHVPIAGRGEGGGRGGSLERLSGCTAQVIYTHVNNTNPVLVEDSPQRAAVEAAGFAVGVDGLHLAVSAAGVRPMRAFAAGHHLPSPAPR